MAVPIRGLFETHLTVRDLDASVAFYRDVLGLELAHTVPDRRVAFVWLGGRGTAMLGLWEAGTSPNRMRLHLAFDCAVGDVLAAPRALRAAGVTPRGFFGAPVEEPDVIAWMPAATVYFDDPDGHSLEYLAVLPDAPRPGRDVVPYGEWLAGRGG